MPPPPGISITSRSPGGTTCKPFGFSSAPDASDSRPARPAPPPLRPRGGKFDPLEAGEHAEGGVLAGADFHHLAQPAAVPAGAAGILRAVPCAR